MSGVDRRPKLVRLESLTPSGWVLHGGHLALALIYPERFVERFRESGKFVRATLLDEHLAPTDEVWVAEDVPEDFSVLVPSKRETGGFCLPQSTKNCKVCGEGHPPPHDGRCLL